MAEGRVLGARAAADLVMPSGVDAGYVLAFQIGQDQNLTAQQMISLAASTIGAKNEMIANKWRRFTYLTTSPYAYYTAGVSGTRQTPNKVEFKTAEPVRSDSNGHTLPYEDFEDAMGWSAQYLRLRMV